MMFVQSVVPISRVHIQDKIMQTLYQVPLHTA